MGGEGERLITTLSPTNKAWNYVVKPFQLPPCTRLMLADVDAGSDTPSLVGKVLKWRQAEGEAGMYDLLHYKQHLLNFKFALTTQRTSSGTNWVLRMILSQKFY